MTLPKTSFAMVQTGPRKLEPRDIPMPEISDDDGLMRIDACGICGSDYEQYEGVLRTPMPAIPGHEPLGTVVAIAGVLLGWKRVGGIHIGMLSLALNLAIAVAGSWLMRDAPGPSSGSAHPTGRGR